MSGKGWWYVEDEQRTVASTFFSDKVASLVMWASCCPEEQLFVHSPHHAGWALPLAYLVSSPSWDKPGMRNQELMRIPTYLFCPESLPLRDWWVVLSHGMLLSHWQGVCSFCWTIAGFSVWMRSTELCLTFFLSPQLNLGKVNRPLPNEGGKDFRAWSVVSSTVFQRLSEQVVLFPYSGW